MTGPEGHGDERTLAILGAAMEVRILRKGFLESIYCHALRIEFATRGIPFDAEAPCAVEYKEQRLGGARSVIGPAECAKVLNDLATTGHARALLLNFGTPRLEYRRLVMGDQVRPTD